MAYKIAGIDVHKKILAVVVCDVEVDGEYQFTRRMFGGSPEQLRALAARGRGRGRGRGSGHGIDRTVLATGMGSAGDVLEADLRTA